MKLLVLALCVCAASATFEYKPYKPYQPVQPTPQYQRYRQPVQSSLQYQTNRQSVPVPVAKNTYNTAKFVTAAPVVGVRKTYNSVKVVPETQVDATRTAYDTAKVVATAPVVTANTAYDTAKFVATIPVVAAKNGYKNAPVVSKNIYEKTPVVAKTTFEKTAVVNKPVYKNTAVVSNSAYPAVATKTVYNNGKEAEAAVLRSENDVSAEGYKYLYETANGIAAQSSGFLKNVEGANVLVSEGSYRYNAPDGTPVLVTYVADENGYQPRSESLPVAPPVPEAIRRSSEYIRAQPPKPDYYN